MEIRKTLQVIPKSEDILKNLSNTNVVLSAMLIAMRFQAVNTTRVPCVWAD